MSVDVFQLVANETFANSIIIRDYKKIYHQDGPQLKNSDQIIQFSFGEKNNFHLLHKA